MSRVNFRAVRDRFTFIDAELVDAQVSLATPDSKLVVRFYAWWEHPLYIEARKRGSGCAFYDTSAGARELTVWPINLASFQLSSSQEVLEWAFLDEHPLLWPYQDHGEVFCNSSVDLEALIRRLDAREIPFATRSTLYQYLDPLRREPAPCFLGSFPLSLFEPLVEELEHMEVEIYLPRRPSRVDLPILLLIDDEDFIIADDFELDVPEFEHRPEWFAATSSSNPSQ